MDFTPLIAQVWTSLAWFIPLMVLIGLLKSPLGKGYVGELLVRLFAHWQLDRQTYQRLHNLTLATPYGTAQSEVERNEMPLPGRQTVINNRIGWARAYLNKAGRLSIPGKGLVQITPRGGEVTTAGPHRITVSWLKQYPEFSALHTTRPSISDTTELPVTTSEHFTSTRCCDGTEYQGGSERRDQAFVRLMSKIAWAVL